VKGRKLILELALLGVLVAVFFVGGVITQSAAQRAAVPKQQDKAALAEANAKELLLLMDTDKSGKISKQEWMKFMEAEFDRLDKDKKGEIDKKALMQSRVLVRHETFQSLGK
jgi:Ca2+-binding EF-hand superfamily protein